MQFLEGVFIENFNSCDNKMMPKYNKIITGIPVGYGESRDFMSKFRSAFHNISGFTGEEIENKYKRYT